MARRKKGRPVNGWLVLDKSSGIGSTQALARVRRLFDARKAGHAGTLDPLATGVLPIAFGQATKTVPYAVDGRKSYQFTVSWGAETNTDDTEGEVVRSSPSRPTESEILARLHAYIGNVRQVPPAFSAIKVAGARAYDLARGGETVELEARTVTIDDLRLVEQPSTDRAVFEAYCGKGTYVRAIARDLGRDLNCFGHICELRRTQVADFSIADAYSLAELEDIAEKDGVEALNRCLRPVEDALLSSLAGLTVSAADASSLARGQAVLMRGRDAPIHDGPAFAMSRGVLVALGEAREGCFHPTRVFNLD